MAKDPNAVAAKWAQNLAASTTSITDGVNSVTVAPGQAAARQKAAWVQNTTSSQDKWAKNTAAVPLGEWQTAMIQKGVPRIATGAAAAQSKQAAFYGKFLPYVDSAVASLPARGTLQQNIQRAVALMTKLSQFSNS